MDSRPVLWSVVACAPMLLFFQEGFGGELRLSAQSFNESWLDSVVEPSATDDSSGSLLSRLYEEPTVRGQSADSGGGSGDLAAKSQNPVSDLASIPLQNNFDFGVEPEGRTRYIGNLQPVVPLKLNEDWNLIARTITPIVNAPLGPDLRSDGIGDTTAQFFLSPRNPESIIWGIGPAFILPTATDQTLGFQEWGAGFSAVALVSESPIVAGVLFNQLYSFQGSTKPMLIQPFFNYNLPKGWFVSVSGEAIADWELTRAQRWSVLGGPGIGRVCPFFGQPMNISVRFAPYLEKPVGGPDWQLRLQAVLLFPR